MSVVGRRCLKFYALSFVVIYSTLFLQSVSMEKGRSDIKFQQKHLNLKLHAQDQLSTIFFVKT